MLFRSASARPLDVARGPGQGSAGRRREVASVCPAHEASPEVSVWRPLGSGTQSGWEKEERRWELDCPPQPTHTHTHTHTHARTHKHTHTHTRSRSGEPSYALGNILEESFPVPRICVPPRCPAILTPCGPRCTGWVPETCGGEEGKPRLLLVARMSLASRHSCLNDLGEVSCPHSRLST